MLESVGSVSFGDCLLLLCHEVRHHAVHHVVHCLIELLGLLLGGLHVLVVALALGGDAGPVHGPLFLPEALGDDAGLVALGVDLDGLQEFGVLLGDGLDHLAPVQVDFVRGTLNDACQLSLVLLFVLLNLLMSLVADRVDIRSEVFQYSELVREIYGLILGNHY